MSKKLLMLIAMFGVSSVSLFAVEGEDVASMDDSYVDGDGYDDSAAPAAGAVEDVYEGEDDADLDGEGAE